MNPPGLPANETARLTALAECGIVDTPEEASFDGLTELTARLLDVPIALVSIVTEDRQWFKSHHGLVARETTRDVSFCGHVVANGARLIVADALADERFADNPLVTGEPFVRFYAGMPLLSSEGFALGTLCAIDQRPRQLDLEGERLLSLVAAQVSALLELKRKDYTLSRERSALAATQAHLRGVFDAMSEGVILIDASGTVTSSNPAAASITGSSSEALLGPLFGRKSNKIVRSDGTLFPAEEWPAALAVRAGKSSSNTVMGLVKASGHTVWLSVNAAALRLVAGESTHGAIITFSDISEQMEIQSALRLSEAGFRAVVASAPMGVSVNHGRTIRYVNDAMVQMLGYDSPAELVGKDALTLVRPSGQERASERFQSLAHGPDLEPAATECVRRDGTAVWVESKTVSIEFDGKPAHIALVRDVTAQHELDQARRESEIALRRSLLEKETLLQEIHHRVKNNLQVIASLLNLQRQQLHSPEAREALAATRNRVQAIALLHERIYRSANLGRIELGGYLRSVVDELLRATVDPGRQVNVNVVSESVSVDMDTAVPLGLIVNELVTNALKHAFRRSPSRDGKIEVIVTCNGQHAELEVSDDGQGLPPEMAPEAGGALGMRLVHSLARQLDGRATFERRIGLTCIVPFRVAAGGDEPASASQ